MKILKKFFSFVVICCVILLIVGCTETGGPYRREFWFLVNDSNTPLHYESYDYNDFLLFNTTLPPKDTLFLYSLKPSPPDEDVDDPSYFYYLTSNKIIIKDDEQTILFYRSETMHCGYDDFVQGEINRYYLTIDADYIASKSCNMPWEDFQKEYLGND